MKEIKCTWCDSKRVSAVGNVHTPDVFRCQKCDRLFINEAYENAMEDKSKRERK